MRDARCVCVVGDRLLSGDPDPTGEKVAILRNALAQTSHIEGFFLECAARAPAARTQIAAVVAVLSLRFCSLRALATRRGRRL